MTPLTETRDQRLPSLAILFVALAATGPAHGETLINTYPTGSTSNIAATASSQINGNNAPKLTVTTNNNGGAEDFIPNVLDDPTDGTEGTGTQMSWRASNGTAAGAASEWIQWDLGAVYELGTVRVWNYNDFNRYASGIRQVDIFVAETPTGDPLATQGNEANGNGWTLWVADAILPVAPGAGGYTGFDLATVLGSAVPITNVRYVRFEVDSTYVGDEIDVGGGLLGGQNASLGQIEFFEASGTPPSVDPKITSFSLSGTTATVTITGDDSATYWCASSVDLSDWTTAETILQTGTATPIPNPFNTSGGSLTFDVDVTGDSTLFLRVQDSDPSP